MYVPLEQYAISKYVVRINNLHNEFRGSGECKQITALSFACVRFMCVGHQSHTSQVYYCNLCCACTLLWHFSREISHWYSEQSVQVEDNTVAPVFNPSLGTLQNDELRSASIKGDVDAVTSLQTAGTDVNTGDLVSTSYHQYHIHSQCVITTKLSLSHYIMSHRMKTLH